jgi:hypothetical protein
LWLALATAAYAATIQVTPADNWTKIEGAKGGDIVEIAPGTYKFRVMLGQTGTATSPITIRAKDPANRPVWDLAGQPVSSWPGSYTAADKGRGCWQVSGSYYVISGIVFKNCQDTASAGLRAINSGPVTVRDCLFASNTNGLTGSSEDFVVEFSELYDNGKLTTTGNMTHNIYIYGGVFRLRYSYVHDPHEGQNFHVRARDAIIEHNWIARPSAYPGDIMSCNNQCGGSGTAPITQKMLLRGNVIIQGQALNLSQLVALYNDEPGGSYDGTGAVSAMELTLEHNTIIGTPVGAGKTQRLVNMLNDSGIATHVHLSNNIIYQVASLSEVASTALSNWSVDGKNNWVSAGTSVSGVTGTIFGATPGFVDANAKNFTLTASSACRAKAATLAAPPTKEYYRDEVVKLMYRARASALDLGAFEHGTTGAGIGPYGSAPPTPDAGAPKDAGVKVDGKKDVGAVRQDGEPPAGDGKPSGDVAPLPDGPTMIDGLKWREAGTGHPDSSGCSCRVGAGAGPLPLPPHALFGCLLAALGLRRLRRR